MAVICRGSVRAKPLNESVFSFPQELIQSRFACVFFYNFRSLAAHGNCLLVQPAPPHTAYSAPQAPRCIKGWEEKGEGMGGNGRTEKGRRGGKEGQERGGRGEEEKGGERRRVRNASHFWVKFAPL